MSYKCHNSKFLYSINANGFMTGDSIQTLRKPNIEQLEYDNGTFINRICSRNIVFFLELITNIVICE